MLKWKINQIRNQEWRKEN